jgi:hypothetical protein
MTLANTAYLSNSTPAAPSGTIAVDFQDDGGSPTVNISANVPIMVGDSGSGGSAGVAPAPPAGSAAAGKYLSAGGGYSAPPGAFGGTFVDELITVSGTSGTLSHTPATLVGFFKNGQRLTALTGTPEFTISGASITLTTAGVSTDVFEAVYFY